jgi:KaiC/GvpD/RAD55 family RecA-like ATPase
MSTIMATIIPGSWRMDPMSFGSCPMAPTISPICRKMPRLLNGLAAIPRKKPKTAPSSPVVSDRPSSGPQLWSVRYGDSTFVPSGLSTVSARKPVEQSLISRKRLSSDRFTMAVRRIKTYIAGLDERMEGGIPEKFVTLICGRAGTLKSSIAYNVLYQNAVHDARRGIYITLEQSRPSLMDHMSKLGMDPRAIEGKGGIAIVDLAKLRKELVEKDEGGKINWPKSLTKTVGNYVTQHGCTLFVLDSLAALYSLTDYENPRSDVFHLFDTIRDLDVTTLLVSEMMEPDKLYYGQYGVEDFLADGILHMEMERDERNVNLFMSVVKMRMTEHDRAYYPLIVEKGGQFEIVTD